MSVHIQARGTAPPIDFPPVYWKLKQFGGGTVTTAFMKLTEQVKSGYTFDPDAIGNIKLFLAKLYPFENRAAFAEYVLHHLVPTRENDSRGFAEHMRILLIDVGLN
ncbi:hypothetical protein BLNAU_24491 [Blattamonas nauphoetae]|uniref:Uncharacterized protein n=1 Tax=Blattamonas nauphoetae TaxID=2049346 RepID=A0ABQ9WMA0_9EUKA|nr:hypothetical protein BLNAU_24491 [Blattamonas nauphoetae]